MGLGRMFFKICFQTSLFSALSKDCTKVWEWNKWETWNRRKYFQSKCFEECKKRTPTCILAVIIKRLPYFCTPAAIPSLFVIQVKRALRYLFRSSYTSGFAWFDKSRASEQSPEFSYNKITFSIQITYQDWKIKPPWRWQIQRRTVATVEKEALFHPFAGCR